MESLRAVLRLCAVVVPVVLVASAAPAGAVVRPWSAVASTCAPDNDTIGHYELSPFEGWVAFAAGAIGSIHFTCNVTTPIDAFPREPDWNRLLLTFSDPDAMGSVQARLYRKHLTTGLVSLMATANSRNVSGIRAVMVPVVGFDFDRYAYFVHVILQRTSSNSSQGFHLVGLRSVP